MSVSAVSGAAASPSTAASDVAKATLDYNAFLTLMLEQMKNQDPTAPVDHAQNLAQLASFSNVEQSIKLNSKLDLLLAQGQAADAAGLIGKTLTSADGTVSGRITSVEIAGQGLVAHLEGGQSLTMATGVRLS
jgi:flagellar basal-body rod modification protein FlgD